MHNTGYAEHKGYAQPGDGCAGIEVCGQRDETDVSTQGPMDYGSEGFVGGDTQGAALP